MDIDFPSPAEIDPGAFTVDLSFDAPAKKETAAESVALGPQRTVTRAKRRIVYDLSKVCNAIGCLGPLPRAGESVHAIMGGDFNAWDLVPAIQAMTKKPIAELIITTLGFNLSNNQHLCDMLDAGAVREAHLLCSSYFEGADKDVFNTAKEKFEARGQRIKAVRNHSKIILIAPAGRKDRYCVESSANLRSCNNLEQLTLTNCATLYNFHKRWIFEVLG